MALHYRTKERDPLDRFYTEDSLAHLIAHEVRALAPGAHHFLEPSSGGGAFIRAINDEWLIDPQRTILAVDIDPMARPAADSEGATFVEGSWLRVASMPLPGVQVFDAILMNPPFATPPPPGRKRGTPVVTEHVRAALERLADGGVCACLVRQSFLATRERAGLFAQFRPARVDILVERPSFTTDGQTDQHEYCVVYWQRESRLLFSRPETTSLRWMSWK